MTADSAASETDPGPDHVGAHRLDGDTDLQTQLDDLRTRLLRDAASAGVSETAVQEAVDDVAGTYRTASVQSFLAVLIERDVRRRLKLSAQPQASGVVESDA